MRTLRCAEVVAVGCYLVLCGCKGTGAPGIFGRGSGGGVKLASADEATKVKLQPVIGCINGTLEHFEKIAPEYWADVARTEAAGAARGPVPNVNWDFQFKIEPYEQNGAMLRECADGLDKAAGMPPAIADIDGPARDAAAALRSLQEPGREMDTYLSQKGYLDDGFTQGRRLDATIAPLLNRVTADAAQLRISERREETGLRRHYLAAIEQKEGHSLQWNTENTMMEARQTNDSLRSLVRGNQLDAGSAQAAIDPLQKAFDEAQAYVAAHAGEGKAGANGVTPMWFSIESGVARELAAAKDLRRTLADTTPTPSDMPKNWHQQEIVRQMGQVTAGFNDAIRSYNQRVDMDELMQRVRH